MKKATEPLRDQIGRALYEEPGRTLNWYALSEQKREPWRLDADRVLKVIEGSFAMSGDEQEDGDCECGEDTCVCLDPSNQ